MKNEVRHKLFCGRTGSGKTNCVLWMLLKLIETTKAWVIVVFPHPQPGEQFIAELYARYGKSILRRLIVEYVADMQSVIMRDFIKFSTASDQYVRMIENDEFSMKFMDMLARGRNFTGWSEHPVLEKYAKLAIGVCQNQNDWMSQSLLPGALMPQSAIWDHYLDHCSVPQLRTELLHTMGMSRRDQLTLLEPAKRLLEQFLGSPPIIARTSRPATFDRRAFLNGGGIYVILGGNCSDDALRILVGADFQETCFLAKKGLLVPGYFVMDEVNNYRLVGVAEARALATMRAFGMNIWLITQAFDWPDHD